VVAIAGQAAICHNRNTHPPHLRPVRRIQLRSKLFRPIMSPIILPGESLAKYKDRIPFCGPPLPATSKISEELAEPATPATDAMVNKTDIELPGSLYASKPCLACPVRQAGWNLIRPRLNRAIEEHLGVWKSESATGGKWCREPAVNLRRVPSTARIPGIPTRSLELERQIWEATRDVVAPGVVAHETEADIAENCGPSLPQIGSPTFRR